MNLLVRFFLSFVLLLLAVGCGETAPTAEMSRIDSLNSRAYAHYYRSLDTVSAVAQQAYKSARYYHTGKAEAANHLGFCAFMRMDFDGAERWFAEVDELTPNELERLIADIGMMKICQRTARNKAYYDFRNRALQKMKRIREDISVFADRHEKQRLRFAFSEFQLVSATYLYYQQQWPEALAALDSISGDVCMKDTSQCIFASYLRGSAGLCPYDSLPQYTLARFDYLNSGLQMSRRCGYPYFEANCLQGISELLMDSCAARLVMKNREDDLLHLSAGAPTDSLFSYRLAQHSLRLFRAYDDLYQIAGTYRTLATWLNRHGKYNEALDTLRLALDCVNLHHTLYYHAADSAARLRCYRPAEALCTELKWINSDSIKTVPEWIARIREQLSVAYAGLERKRESDYNRNCYLDILYNIRQDKELESRYQALEREAAQLNWIIASVVCGMFFMFVSFWLLNRHWQRRNRLNQEILRDTLELCRHIVMPLPAGTAGAEDIAEVLMQRIRPYFQRIFEATDVQLSLDTAHLSAAETWYRACFPLRASSQDTLTGMLVLTSSRRWTKERKALVRLITPYLVWVVENGQALLLLDDQVRQLEKQRYVHEQHVEENKRQNVVKKACLAIVDGVKPFIDRIVNEVDKLRDKRYANRPAVRAEKYQYIRELVERINEYNDILALWIKMKQGTLNLSLENFALSEVLGVVAKSQRTFETKKQTLQVDACQLVVKADKALTLFMINTLADNARKYTQEGGRVHIYAAEFSDYVEISVEDNGRGLSAEDVHRLLDEKVYDSKEIGMKDGPDEMLARNKGFGFGLMNCKGIIEKYRKTNALFQVCTFGIESQPGKGSRFYFRLPKGVKKVFGWLLMLVSAAFTASCDGLGRNDAVGVHPPVAVPGHDTDRMLDEAARYADRVYEHNWYGEYHEALCCADSAISLLNAHYTACTGLPGKMTLRGNGVVTEITWWKDNFWSDFHVILDLRNEAAVAFLALKDWDAYTYNNEAYTMLYKLVGEDTSLAAYCNQLQHSTSNKIVGILLCVLLLVVLLIGYYVLFIARKSANYRHLEQVLDINRSAFNATLPCAGDTDDCLAVPARLVDACFDLLVELLAIDLLGLAVFDPERKNLRFTCHPSGADTGDLDALMQQCYEKQQPIHSAHGEVQCFPLLTEMGESVSCVGVLAWSRADGRVKESDRLLSELIARYMALIIYGAVLKPVSKHQDIELVGDELRRASFEDNQLHVQNMVLDNCLSTIKHETIYYPNRIKQIVERLVAKPDSVKEEAEEVDAIFELVSYYREIYGILSSCASRQLEGVTFRRTAVRVAEVLQQAARYHKRMVRKRLSAPGLEIESCAEGLTVLADKTELCFLLENLIAEAVAVEEGGTLALSAKADGDFVRFVFEDRRGTYAQADLNLLFYPSLQRMKCDTSGSLKGTAYLVCKQIIRDHDEYAGLRGCRIVAEPGTQGGFQIYFTIPKKQ